MAHLIDKDALVAEIERRISQLESKYKELSNFEVWVTAKEIKCKINGLKEALSIVNILEVREVDLNKEIEKCLKKHSMLAVGRRDFTDIAKHFFELGMAARTDKELVEEVYSHIDGIKDTADRMTSGNFMHNRAAIKFSANTIAKVLELMGIKAQKGK